MLFFLSILVKLKVDLYVYIEIEMNSGLCKYNFTRIHNLFLKNFQLSSFNTNRTETRSNMKRIEKKSKIEIESNSNFKSQTSERTSDFFFVSLFPFWLCSNTVKWEKKSWMQFAMKSVSEWMNENFLNMHVFCIKMFKCVSSKRKTRLLKLSWKMRNENMKRKL
jgi:hypothetical protein